MDHGIFDLWELGHDEVFDHMRHAMGLVEPHRRIHPDVQIQKYMIGRAAGPDLLAAQHLGYALDDDADVVGRDHDFVGQDT